MNDTRDAVMGGCALTELVFRRELGSPGKIASLWLAVPATVPGWKAALGLESEE